MNDNIENLAKLSQINLNRIETLLKRINLFLILLTSIQSAGTLNLFDPNISISILIFRALLEELKDYLLKISKKDKTLLIHLIKSGADEEIFIKFNESIKNSQLIFFTKDKATLKKELKEF